MLGQFTWLRQKIWGAAEGEKIECKGARVDEEELEARHTKTRI